MTRGVLRYSQSIFDTVTKEFLNCYDNKESLSKNPLKNLFPLHLVD